MIFRSVYALIAFTLFAAGPRAADDAAIAVSAEPLAQSVCSGTFISHLLPHTTEVRQQPIRMYESNGSGLAINDLNKDGWLDIVLANLDGPNTILWNHGGLVFERQEFRVMSRTRAVVIIDVDADDWLDIVLTTQAGRPSWWRNMGDQTFEREQLPGVESSAYAMNWGDLDADGDLDLVTGSYDAELERRLGDTFMFSRRAGVFYYENQNGEFVPTRLADSAQALTVLLTDLNGDARPDIAVGNDFTMPDRFWSLQNGEWIEIQPFQTMTLSTMSFDAGDIDNDSQNDFFAADMQPYAGENADNWRWVLANLERQPRLPDDPQVMVNALQAPNSGGDYRAVDAGIAATGWSWSAKFGDLDNDGYLDLYVVNGMIASDLFGNLPNDELIEENQALHNMGGGSFVPAPEWALNSLRSGRGMSMADLDQDGDLDIVVNNLMSPAELFENQVCGGDALLLELRRTDVANSLAIGARVELNTSTGVYSREVRATSGYISGDPSTLHFGFPVGSVLDYLEIQWGDGTVSRLDAPAPNTHISVTRT